MQQTPPRPAAPHARLLHALNEWLASIGVADCVSSLPLPIDSPASPASSCAVFSIYSTRVRELLYVVRSLHRARIELRVLRRALKLTATECPLREWCSFCDGDDACMRLRVLFNDVKQFHRAIASSSFDENEIVSTESPSLKRVRRAIKKMRKANNAARDADDDGAAPIARRPPLIELCIDYFPSVEKERSLRRLRDALALYTESMNEATARPLLRIAYVQVTNLSYGAHVAFATTSIAVIEDDASRDWSCLQPATATAAAAADKEDQEDGGESTLLAAGNFVRVDARVLQYGDAVSRFHKTLRGHAPRSLQEMRLHYGFLNAAIAARDADAHRERVHDIADTFFSRRSRLALDRLRLSGEITQRDLQLMIERLQGEVHDDHEEQEEKTTTCRPALRRLECSMWMWQRDDASTTSLRVRGETLATLLRHRGGRGVDTLCVSLPRVPVVEIPSLAACCRHLDVKMSSADWHLLQHQSDETKDDDDDGDAWAADAGLRLESLRLEVEGDEDDDGRKTPGAKTTTLALCVLLQRLGRSLRALTLAPHALRGRIAFDGARIASAIVLRCPQLQELDVDTVDERFVAAFVQDLGRLYARAPCRLARLSLRVRGGNNDEDQDSSVTFLALLSALHVATHPLTRSLRSLRLELHLFSGREECERMARALQELLTRNTRLRDVTLCVPHDGIDTQEEEDSGGQYAAVMAPLRHQLALLSALRARHLPRDVLESVMEMASHRRRRLRVLCKRPSGSVMNMATGAILAPPGGDWLRHGITIMAG